MKHSTNIRHVINIPHTHIVFDCSSIKEHTSHIRHVTHIPKLRSWLNELALLNMQKDLEKVQRDLEKAQKKQDKEREKAALNALKASWKRCRQVGGEP